MRHASASALVLLPFRGQVDEDQILRPIMVFILNSQIYLRTVGVLPLPPSANLDVNSSWTDVGDSPQRKADSRARIFRHMFLRDIVLEEKVCFPAMDEEAAGLKIDGRLGMVGLALQYELPGDAQAHGHDNTAGRVSPLSCRNETQYCRSGRNR